MKSGLERGMYEAFLTVSGLGATGPLPLSIFTAFIVLPARGAKYAYGT